MSEENILIDFTEAVCPECGAERIYYDTERSEKICKQCGLILREKIPMLLGGGLNNPFRNVDSNKNKLSPSMYSLMRRFRKWQRQFGINTSKDRGLSIMLDMLRSFSLLLDIKEPVIAEAVLILRKFFKNNNLSGRNYESFIAAVFYAACKIKRNPRNIKEISDITSVSKKDIGRNYRFLVKTLKLQVPLLKLSEYLPRVVALSGVSMKIERRALEVLNNVKKTSGNVPWGIAGAAIYIAAKEYGENITQREVAEIVGLTEATIRTQYQELKKKLKL